MNPDPRTSLAETEVAKILHLKRITDETLDGFNDAPRITRVPINEAQNELAQIAMPLTTIPQIITTTTKRTRGSDKQSRKKKAIKLTNLGIISQEIATHLAGLPIHDDISMHNVPSIPMKNNLGIGRNKNKLSKELSILYCAIDDIWDKPSITIDESFAYMIIEALSFEEDDPEPQTIEETMRRSNWSK